MIVVTEAAATSRVSTLMELTSFKAHHMFAVAPPRRRIKAFCYLARASFYPCEIEKTWSSMASARKKMT
jgi:hypothetical protein